VDEHGFTEWAAGCQRRLLRAAYLLTGDMHRAEDLVQEALTKVALRWSRLAEGNPTAYALRIIARDNVSWWRRRRDVPTEGLPDGPPGGVARTEPEIALVVRRALGRLTPGQRAVLVLRHFEDLTERETAEVLGVSLGTVKSQNAAGLARLRTGAPELRSLIGRTP
jgi:RNA polymerase sigma-70 factor (sigma-E family)